MDENEEVEREDYGEEEDEEDKDKRDEEEDKEDKNKRDDDDEEEGKVNKDNFDEDKDEDKTPVTTWKVITLPLRECSFPGSFPLCRAK